MSFLQHTTHKTYVIKEIHLIITANVDIKRHRLFRRPYLRRQLNHLRRRALHIIYIPYIPPRRPLARRIRGHDRKVRALDQLHQQAGGALRGVWARGRGECECAAQDGVVLQCGPALGCAQGGPSEDYFSMRFGVKLVRGDGPDVWEGDF